MEINLPFYQHGSRNTQPFRLSIRLYLPLACLPNIHHGRHS